MTAATTVRRRPNTRQRKRAFGKAPKRGRRVTFKFPADSDAVLFAETGAETTKDEIIISLEAVKDDAKLCKEILRAVLLSLDPENDLRQILPRLGLPNLRVRISKHRAIPYGLLFTPIRDMEPRKRKHYLTAALSDLQAHVSLQEFIDDNPDVDIEIDRELRTISVTGELPVKTPGREQLISGRVRVTRSYDTGEVIDRTIVL